MKTLLIALAAVLTAAWGMPQRDTRGLLDDLMGQVIEGIKPSLHNLTLPNINTTFEQSGISLHLVTNNITTEKLDGFQELVVNTTLLPLRLVNLTLLWEEFSLVGDYSLNGVIDLSDITQGPIELDGEGGVSATLRNLILTAAADFKFIGGKLQIVELYNLDISLESSSVNLENLFGGGDLEQIFNVFLSFFLPQLLNDQGTAMMESLAPMLKDLLNELLEDILYGN